MLVMIIVLAVFVALSLFAELWAINQAREIGTSVSPVLKKWKSDLLIDDYEKKEYHD